MNHDLNGHDVTSGLPDDVIMIMVTLTMGHRQTTTSGLCDDIHQTTYLHYWLMSSLGWWPWQCNWQLLNKFLCTRPDYDFVEFMAWSLSGIPSGPLPVYVSFSTKETAKTNDPTAPLAVYPRINCLPAVGVTNPAAQLAVASKIQLPNGLSC